MITFNKEEAKAVLDIIDQLSGGNVDTVFGAEAATSPDATDQAFIKLYLAAEKTLPWKD